MAFPLIILMNKYQRLRTRDARVNTRTAPYTALSLYYRTALRVQCYCLRADRANRCAHAALYTVESNACVRIQYQPRDAVSFPEIIWSYQRS